MDEEELTKILENVDIPIIKLNNHRNRLKESILAIGFPHKHQRSKKQIAFILVPIMLAVIAVLVFEPWTFFSNSHPNARVLANNAITNINSILLDLSPNTILYMKRSEYRRQPPASFTVPNAQENAAGQSDSLLTLESSIQESWMQIDSKGYVSHERRKITSTSGELYSTSETIDGELISLDAKTGEVFKTEYIPYDIEKYVKGIVDWPERLKEQGWKYVDRGNWDGQETLIFEKSQIPWPPGSSGEGTQANKLMGISGNLSGKTVIVRVVSPWTYDLNPVSSIWRIEVVSENPIVSKYQWYIIGKDGNETLILETTVLEIEILDQSPI